MKLWWQAEVATLIGKQPLIPCVFWLVQKAALLQETPVLADGKVFFLDFDVVLFCFSKSLSLRTDQHPENLGCDQHFFRSFSDAGAQVSSVARRRADFVVFDEIGKRNAVLGRGHVQAE